MIHDEPSIEDALREILLLMPQVIARLKRSGVPPEFGSMALGPRHLPLLAYLHYDGAMTVNELAQRLEVAAATVSLMLAELSRHGLVERHPDDADRRRTIVSIGSNHGPAIERWIGHSAAAWRRTFADMQPAERAVFLRTLRRYERELAQRHS
ncbi:MAG TPA: helix-turn-helix domain-containing protein [Solirubrobacteraceae bacterium]|nr:helix-turn-helix domain-containing protein [Solirubrobacteraceae bacterium]